MFESKFSSHSQEKEKASRKRDKAIPPEASLSFDEILKLAALKQHEPLKSDRSLKANEKDPDSGRLMTQKEREDARKKQDAEKRRSEREKNSVTLSEKRDVSPKSQQKGRTAAAKKRAPCVETERSNKELIRTSKGSRGSPRNLKTEPLLPFVSDRAFNVISNSSVCSAASTTLSEVKCKVVSNASCLSKKQVGSTERPSVKGKSLAPSSGRQISGKNHLITHCSLGK